MMTFDSRSSLATNFSSYIATLLRFTPFGRPKYDVGMKIAATTQENLVSAEIVSVPTAALRINAARTVRFIGSVTHAMSERVLDKIKRLVEKSPFEEVTLMVTSTGGPTGIAMNFFDTVHQVLRPALTTVGSGDVDSSGILIFLTGDKRYVTKGTTLLFHSAGRRFGSERYTTREMESMLAEDRLKDAQYAELVAERSRGQLTAAEVLVLMERHTVMSPHELVGKGLADAVLE
jgi:ATP-dependent protease ClpP protease subunit